MSGGANPAPACRGLGALMGAPRPTLPGPVQSFNVLALHRPRHPRLLRVVAMKALLYFGAAVAAGIVLAILFSLLLGAW